MTQQVKIFIVDDHTLLRDGLKVMLDAEEDLQVVGMSGSCAEAVEKMADLQVDVVLMDYDLKGSYGPDAIREIREIYPDANIMALTSYDEKGVIRAMVQAGAISYMLKDADRSELYTAIRSTAKGVSWFSQDISRILLQDLLPARNGSAKPAHDCDPQSLTTREIEVLKLIVAEKTNNEIAEDLFISAKTVENHRSNLMQKIGAKNTAGLVKYALRHSLDQ